MNDLEIAGWIVMASIVLIILCFYFTLTFIESAIKGNQRIAKQSKLAAVIIFGLALFIPIIYSIIF